MCVCMCVGVCVLCVCVVCACVRVCVCFLYVVVVVVCVCVVEQTYVRCVFSTCLLSPQLYLPLGTHSEAGIPWLVSPLDEF